MGAGKAVSDMGAKQTRCPDMKRIGNRLVFPCGEELALRRGVLQRRACGESEWWPHFRWDPDPPDIDQPYIPCPPKTTLQVWKWLGEQLGYEIEG